MVLRAFSFLAAIFILQSAVRAADTNPPPRLTVELRDGSRVVGASAENYFKFHSALLGDLKLAVKNIRSVDCVSSNAAKLTTAGGDVLTVSFMDADFAVNTSFGKVELATDSIRKFSVSMSGAAGRHRAGLVALWSGEDDGKDSVGGNDATLMDMAFADGKVGRAFSLNGFSSWLKIPASATLDVGKGDGLTLSVWIKPANVVSFRPILEWNATTHAGVHLWLGHLPQQQGELFANLVDTDGNAHGLYSPLHAVWPGEFQHVALTYDKNSGVGRLFVNGCVVAQDNLGSFTPQTSYDLLVSRRPGDHPGDWTYNAFFSGLLDEISIYNRALSAEEIKAIGTEENHGDPLPPPRIGSPMPFNGIYRGGPGE